MEHRAQSSSTNDSQDLLRCAALKLWLSSFPCPCGPGSWAGGLASRGDAAGRKVRPVKTCGGHSHFISPTQLWCWDAAVTMVSGRDWEGFTKLKIPNSNTSSGNGIPCESYLINYSLVQSLPQGWILKLYNHRECIGTSLPSQCSKSIVKFKNVQFI